MTPNEWMAALESQLRIDEGVRYTVYLDNSKPPIPTIGVGHNCKVSPLPNSWGCTITDAEVNYLLAQDIQIALNSLDAHLPWWRSMSDARRLVLANMAFNLGIGKLLGFHHALAAMQSSDFDAAADQMKNSDWYAQVGNRAVRLVKAMREG